MQCRNNFYVTEDLNASWFIYLEQELLLTDQFNKRLDKSDILEGWQPYTLSWEQVPLHTVGLP